MTPYQHGHRTCHNTNIMSPSKLPYLHYVTIKVILHSICHSQIDPTLCHYQIDPTLCHYQIYPT